jgi:hypothetical protein
MYRRLIALRVALILCLLIVVTSSVNAQRGKRSTSQTGSDAEPQSSTKKSDSKNIPNENSNSQAASNKSSLKTSVLKNISTVEKKMYIVRKQELNLEDGNPKLTLELHIKELNPMRVAFGEIVEGKFLASNTITKVVEVPSAKTVTLNYELPNKTDGDLGIGLFYLNDKLPVASKPSKIISKQEDDVVDSNTDTKSVKPSERYASLLQKHVAEGGDVYDGFMFGVDPSYYGDLRKKDDATYEVRNLKPILPILPKVLRDYARNLGSGLILSLDSEGKVAIVQLYYSFDKYDAKQGNVAVFRERLNDYLDSKGVPRNKKFSKRLPASVRQSLIQNNKDLSTFDVGIQEDVLQDRKYGIYCYDYILMENLTVTEQGVRLRFSTLNLLRDLRD